MFAINFKRSCYCILFIALFALRPELSFASESASISNEQSKYWITTGFRSHHPNRSAQYNETNTGIGFEYHQDDEFVWAVGHYENSVRRQTTYVHYVYTPFKIANVKMGGAVGIVNGYPGLRDGKFTPVLLPVASMTFKVFGRNVGVNAVYIPSVVPDTDSAFAVQLKLALD